MPLDSTPTLGLIVPPASGAVPGDAARLYGSRVRFIARGLGLGEISPSGFNTVIDTVLDKARELRDAGAQAISLMGTSISFYRGAAFTEELRQAMQQATGLPCTTMSHAIVEALRALGLRRVAVATSYIDELNDRLVDYLSGAGFEVTAIRGLSITGVQAVGDVPPQTLIELATSVYRENPAADGIFISCGGLLTLDVIPALEASLGVPAASSSPAGFWNVMKVAGLEPGADGFGRLFSPARQRQADPAA
ncbi:aspartate/glutamate racemase family protein [Variovorax terrae]|uniref:Aspartate/glutamate racemase family protein n=1 Tax=Variovorax terrae TaxID=2923278 RepID=A0A9X1VTS5_9BURK|nr:aspartate/glutamate racemase family protein [Variovorax terrae]MCJ0763691.1 aspartate/glutamate racemase family protein [Variovorax terrae]